MLPWLVKKQGTANSPSLSVLERRPDGEIEPESEDSGLEAAFEDLCKAVESKDYKAGAKALRAAFEILDSEPHREGPHIED